MYKQEQPLKLREKPNHNINQVEIIQNEDKQTLGKTGAHITTA